MLQCSPPPTCFVPTLPHTRARARVFVVVVADAVVVFHRHHHHHHLLLLLPLPSFFRAVLALLVLCLLYFWLSIFSLRQANAIRAETLNIEVRSGCQVEVGSAFAALPISLTVPRPSHNPHPPIHRYPRMRPSSNFIFSVMPRCAGCCSSLPSWYLRRRQATLAQTRMMTRRHRRPRWAIC